MKLPRDYLILGAEGSLPSRERGLKPAAAAVNVGAELVAPLAGAWIETDDRTVSIDFAGGRSPRGSVD